MCGSLFQKNCLTDFCMLRCDRNEPCSSCLSRGIPCSYTSSPQPKSLSKERKQVNNSLERIRRLEELVASLTSSQQATGQASSTTPARGGTSSGADATSFQSFLNSGPRVSSSNELPRDQPSHNTGKIEVSSSHTVYVSAAHWTTIRDEVRHCNYAYIQHLLRCRY